ncbi:MAG: zinc-ribbon domain-containing protein, partial [Candidatus Obscuribacterales bacterium]|nr:zinc-ribbon domain-containing protein [Candidatus Obscuribacterales bacterium]
NGKLRVEDFTYASGKMVWWRCSECRHSWQAAIADRTKLESGCPACYEARMKYAREHPPARKRGHVVLSKKSDGVSRAWYEAARIEFIPLSKSHPEVAKLWHPSANGKWTPDDFAHGSEAIAWWKCPKGPDHEWQSPIYARTSERRSKCPFCTGKRVSVTNSLASLFPETAEEWHPSLNMLKANQVTAHSSKKAFWKCKTNNEHVWKTSIGLRTRGSGCPFCLRVRASNDNNIKVLFPKIAAELHPTKNKGLKAEDIAPSSGRHIWWKCGKARDHEWQATPANRTGRKSGCPCCAGKKVSVTNSLASVFPKIAAEWHKIKNGGFKPTDFTYGSSRMSWWLCYAGHAWQQSIKGRTKRQSGCQKCRKLKINSLDPPKPKTAVLTKPEKIDFFDI